MRRKDAGKKQRIMDVTREIVHEKGLVGIKMSEVAKRVKISPSNLYIYFKNKEDLLSSTFFDTFKLIGKELEPDDSADIPFKLKVQRVFQLLIMMKLTQKEYYSFFGQYMRSSYFKKEYNPLMDSMGKSFFDLFDRAQKERIIKDDVELMLILALIEGLSDKLVEFHNMGKIGLDEKTVEKSFSLVWDALKK